MINITIVITFIVYQSQSINLIIVLSQKKKKNLIIVKNNFMKFVMRLDLLKIKI